MFFFFLRNTNIHKRTHICFSEVFDLQKIRFTQDLPERNDCLSQKASVLIFIITIVIIIIVNGDFLK
jgi:hypothetical protein